MSEHYLSYIIINEKHFLHISGIARDDEMVFYCFVFNFLECAFSSPTLKMKNIITKSMCTVRRRRRRRYGTFIAFFI